MATKIERVFFWIGYVVGAAAEMLKSGLTSGYAAGQARKSNADKRRQVMTLVNGNLRVDAIKLYRNLFGSTLKDAYDAVSAMEKKK